MEDCELLEGTKLHLKGRVVKSPYIQADGDVYSFQGGRSTGVVKFLEPLSPLLNYFEYVILNKGRETAIGIGCGERGYPMSRMPGWNRNSCGYHADDGKLYNESGMGRAFGPTCTTGDRMGCGVNFDSGLDRGDVELFFTKNGNPVGDVVKLKRPLNGIYPLIGLHSNGEKIRYLGHWRRVIDGVTEPMEEDEGPETRWLRSNGIRFVDNGLTLEYAGIGGQVQDVGIAQSRYPLDRTNHYFEIEIVEEGALGALAIGLGKTTYPLHRHPGWNAGGIGYHADDGKLFKGKGQGDVFGPSCTVGDRMGCGIRFPVCMERDEEGGTESEESEVENEDNEAASLPLKYLLSESSDSDDSDSSDKSEESYSGDSLDLMHEPLRGPFNLGGRHVRQALMEGVLEGMLRPPILRVPQERKPNRSAGSRKTCKVYFTKNGETVGEVDCDVPRGGFYPVVAMLSHGEKLRVNFNPLSG